MSLDINDKFDAYVLECLFVLAFTGSIFMWEALLHQSNIRLQLDVYG